ncbi:MAG: CIA30 family protein [Saprospiraceae bacterium]
MKIILMFFLAVLLTNNQSVKIDFGKNKDGKDWQIVNDGVMGGRSQSTISFEKNSMIFKGNVSLENNGGFASMRASFGEYDFSKYETMTMRFRGTARKFAVTMQKEAVFYLPNYKYFFTPNPDEWQTLEMKLTDFETYQMGRAIGGTVSEEDLTKIIRYGIILYDKKAGDFELEIDYIEFK